TATCSVSLSETKPDQEKDESSLMGECGWTEEDPFKIDSNDKKIRISADNASYEEGDITALSGDVKITGRGQQIRASQITIDNSTQSYSGEGAISLNRPDFLIRGERIRGNLLEETADLEDASFLLKDSLLRGGANSLRQEKDTVSILQGSLTSCESKDNTWRITSSQIRLKKAETFGSASNVVLRVKGLPIGYLPFMQFPVGEERKTGFLWPAIGHSNVGGTDLAIPYYFNISPSKDAIYTLRNISQRGLMHEGELRFLNSFSKNAIGSTFLHKDKQTALGRSKENKEDDRWLLQINHRGRSGSWSSGINYTNISDIYYFDDLGDFSSSDSEFTKFQNRTNASSLLQMGSVQYAGGKWDANLEFRNFKSLEPTEPKQYSVLPRLTVSGGVKLGPVSTKGFLQATEFDSNAEEAPTGRRLVLDVHLSSEFKRPWGFIEPSFRALTKRYKIDTPESTQVERETVSAVQTAIASGLIFDRPLSLWGKNFYQTLEPRVLYLYSHETDTDLIPSFDSVELSNGINQIFRKTRFSGFDRLGNSHQISSIVKTSMISARRGKEIFSASIGKVFYLQEYKKISREPLKQDETSKKSPLVFSASVSGKHFDIIGNYELSTAKNQSNKGFLGIRYSPSESSSFNLNYAMDLDNPHRNKDSYESEEMDFAFAVKLREDLKLIGRWNYGLSSDQTLDSLLGFELDDCCWSAKLVLRRHKEKLRENLFAGRESQDKFLQQLQETGIYFEFELKGLASIGRRIDSLIDYSLQGIK
ncbi:MAG: LPS assembly protein LptD, partial [Pseudomonadota bacterium]|nr:LPS assembly protein LptD [Pseudomonadota bacterium]